MDILASICSLDPFIKTEGHTKILHTPTKLTLQMGHPFEFEFRVDDALASWQRYTIYKDKLSISRLPAVGWPYREQIMKDVPHEEGLPILSVVAGAKVLATMKRLGLFELAERILDAQSSAFPSLRS